MRNEEKTWGGTGFMHENDKNANPPLFARGMEQTHSDNIYFEMWSS